MKRVAMITGAGSGIGRATALKLGGLGYAVALVGRTRATLESVAAELAGEAGGRTESLTLPVDVSQAQEVAHAVAAVEARWGRLDVLVNNAGYAPTVSLATLSDEQWHRILETNLSAAFYATRAVWPIFERQYRAGAAAGELGGKGGVIVNISSMAARDPFPGLGAYGVAKLGLNMLTLVTAREGHAVGIRAVGIAPAAVDTPMFRSLVEGMGAKVEQDTMLRPEEVADLVAEAAQGSLRWAAGETLFVHRRPA